MRKISFSGKGSGVATGGGASGATAPPPSKVGISYFVSGPREYIMEGEYVILGMCSWFRIR